MGEDSTASNQKYTKGEYLRLAANNDSHFAKKNQQTWEAMHIEAIQVAMNAGKDDMEFNRALFIEAASGHFLTDAYSSGHQFEKGPLMAAISDGYLSRSPETQRIAALAVFESRQQIFQARATGKSPKVANVRTFFPNDKTIDRANEQAIAYIPEARKQVEQILYHERREAKSKLGDVGGYLVQHNLEAIGDPLRERNILQQQDFDRRQGGPGTAVGAQFQWRLGK